MNRQPIYIRWVDSSHTSAWTDHEEHEPATLADLTCETVGFLYHETDLAIEVVQSCCKDQYDAIMIIPKIAILSLKHLAPKRKPNVLPA